MRKHVLQGLMIFGCLLAGSHARAQQPIHCGTDEQLRKMYAEHPELEEDYRRFAENNIRMSNDGGPTRFIYRIPVVFHILHEYGSENITDAQVYDEMEVLNQDYRKLNPDIGEVIPQFAGIAADCQIEFQLATLDPYGNCTNGIEHIYTHLTHSGDDYSKLNQWHRSRYLNIWVVDDFDEMGLQAYAYYPTAVEGAFFFSDGVIVLNTTVGSIGTAVFGNKHVLSHEIGHFLGLPHTWGSTNDPNTGCGDDGIADTPITRGHDNCNNLYDSTCVPGIIENVQNFMEYSGCNRMFTLGQSAFMTNTLEGETGQRNNLWTEETHTLTGVDVIPPPTCIPAADFSVDHRMACVGDPVHFKDASWRAGVTSFAWSFPGGMPSTSTDANPTVIYQQDGYYSVTLTVTNAAGSDTKTFTDMLYISGDWSAYTGPVMDDYEGVSANWWVVQNPEDNYGEFTLTANEGKNLSTCYALKSYRSTAQATPFTDDWFYPNRLGGSKDYLISPSYDLAGTSNISVSFDYAYGTNATTLDDVTEELRVYTSHDCGKTWQLRSNATLDGSDLLTVGYVGDHSFVPASNQEWKTQTFTYTSSGLDTKMRFRFEFVASDKSNNLYIDNINITGTLGISENDETSPLISLSPNPVQSGGTIHVQVDNSAQDLSLALYDMNGQLISVTQVPASNGTQTVQVSAPIAKGCYFLNALRGTAKTINRVIVF